MTCRLDEKIRKMDEQLMKHRDVIKKTRPGPAQEAAKRRALSVWPISWPALLFQCSEQGRAVPGLHARPASRDLPRACIPPTSGSLPSPGIIHACQEQTLSNPESMDAHRMKQRSGGP